MDTTPIRKTWSSILTHTPTQIRVVDLDDEDSLIVDAADDLGNTVGVFWRFPDMDAIRAALPEIRATLEAEGVTDAATLPLILPRRWAA